VEVLVQGTTITTTIGSLGFELAGASRALFPVVAPRPICSIQGDVVASVWEDGVCYLLIDHRVDASPDRLARVELWRPVEEGEAPLGGLFVVADTYTATPGSGLHPSLASLVATILTK